MSHFAVEEDPIPCAEMRARVYTHDWEAKWANEPPQQLQSWTCRRCHLEEMGVFHPMVQLSCEECQRLVAGHNWKLEWFEDFNRWEWSCQNCDLLGDGGQYPTAEVSCGKMLMEEVLG